MPNPNSNRGPWCLICGVEMNRPNHRFQVTVRDDGGYEAHRYKGDLRPSFEPICGETCLQKAHARWAGGVPFTGSADSQADGVKE